MRTDVLILLVCLFFTLYNVGMIWTLQLNHYPLYARVGRGDFREYIAAHNKLLLLPIVLPGLIAFASSLLLIWWLPAEIPDWSVWLPISLNVAIVASTVLVQGPAHNALARDGYSESVVRKIITTNWARTVAWTANGLVLLWMTALVANT